MENAISSDWDRRRFLKSALAAPAGLSLAASAIANPLLAEPASQQPSPGQAAKRPEYRGPNVIIVRFGGGVRRRETIDPAHTHSPYFCHELTRRGTLFPKMDIASLEGIETSHGQGTLFILTGKYDRYQDVHGRFLGDRFEAKVPTLFEYFRKQFAVYSAHQTLIVNGEDRIDEEFYTFSNHHLFGVNYRSEVLSLYRFKTHLLRRQIAEGKWDDDELEAKRRELVEMESLDHRAAAGGTGRRNGQGDEIEGFWDRWRRYYGETGLVNPRGDRLLTELAIRAMRQLRPRLLMVNYNDPDYVHWGNLAHYTRGISIIDEGIGRLVSAVEADEEYRENTVFAIVPDCGRDTNRFIAVPCQHHFGSKSSHEIFALFFGPGIPRGAVVDKPADQISMAATIGQLMGFRPAHAEGPVLSEAFA